MRDPKIDVDIVRLAATLSCYDNDYRRPTSEYPDDFSLDLKQEVSRKLHDLKIDDDDEAADSTTAKPEVMDEDEKFNIVEETSTLHICDETGETVEAAEQLANVEITFSAKFRE